MDLNLILPGISAVATVVLAGYAAIQANAAKRTAEANRDMLEEMKVSREANNRPLVLVEIDYSRSPSLDLVIRNVGRGVAKDVKCRASEDILLLNITNPRNNVTSNWVLSDAPYFRNAGYLAPGGEVAFYWGHAYDIVEELNQRNLEDGITVTVTYSSLEDKPYSESWILNPSAHENRMPPNPKKLPDLVEAVEIISKKVSKAVSATGELKVSTPSQRRKEARREKRALGVPDPWWRRLFGK